MAALDISQLQNILNNAAKNETLVNNIRKAAKRATSALDELNALLEDSYEPAAKERKPRQPRAPRVLGETDGDAPYGRKANGTPRAKPGRSVDVGTATGEEEPAERKPYVITVDGEYRLYNGKYTSNADHKEIKIYTGNPANMKAKLIKNEGIAEEAFKVVYL